MDEKMFPVLFGHGDHRRELESLGCPREVPWSLLEAHEKQALRNHDQSLQRLAERGGLSPCEMVAVIEDRQWHRMPNAEALAAISRALETK